MEWEEYQAGEEDREIAKYESEIEALRAAAISSVRALYCQTEGIDCDNEADIALQRINSQIEYLSRIAMGDFVNA